MSTTPNPMTIDDACRYVARHVVYDLIDRYLDIGDGWEDYPEIGEHDWNRVGAHVAGMCLRVMDDAKYAEAYALLAARAGSDDES